MDMYQKRKMRKEKNVDKQENVNSNKMNINWYIPTFVNSLQKLYK